MERQKSRVTAITKFDDIQKRLEALSIRIRARAVEQIVITACHWRPSYRDKYGMPHLRQRVLAVFDWSQKAAEIWRGSNTTARRQILDSICLNRTLNDVTLVTTKRKPFEFFVERLDLKKSRGNKTPIELFRPPISEFKSDVAGLIRDATPDFKGASASRSIP